MKRLGIVLALMVVAVLMCKPSFAAAPAAQQTGPELAKASFLQSLQAAPEPSGFFTPAPTLRTCVGSCFVTYRNCKNACGSNLDCQSACRDAYDNCVCGCGSCP
jgi:hypothetical protein